MWEFCTTTRGVTGVASHPATGSFTISLGEQAVGMDYFGCGVIGDLSIDHPDGNSFNAELLDYMPFKKRVPVAHGGNYLEPDITQPANFRGNAVRIVSVETARLIVRRSRTDVPWTWDDSPDAPAATTALALTGSSEHVLRQRLAELDRKYGSSNPQERRRMLTALHRPSSIANVIKQLYGTTCAICGYEGFEKRDGRRYAEVHHVDELSAGNPGTLASRNIMVVCANCHRMMHYADVVVREVGDGWQVSVNDQQHFINRLSEPDTGHQVAPE